MKNVKYLILGFLFGFILIKSEVISWFRIQEMFRFQSFHMYGVMMSAVIVGATSIALLKRFKVKTISGEPITIAPKKFTWGNVWGGLLFGLGWALTGACPGPLYALVGSGVYVIGIALISALFGVYVYGILEKKLPH